jgi:aminoglycoside phosphotransferase
MSDGQESATGTGIWPLPPAVWRRTGDSAGPALLAEYGLQKVDTDKVEFYRLIDEFF